MTKYLLFYTFHELNSLSINRLEQIKQLNPEVEIVPCFGAGQKTFLSKAQNRMSLEFNLKFYQSPYLQKYLLENSSRRLGQKKINDIRIALNKLGLKPYFDFTSLGYYNQDKVIINWFRSNGEKYDFDYLIYLEYDIFMTRSVKNIYDKYAKYDAAFVDFEKPGLSWMWTKIPFGVKKTLYSWMRNNGYKPKLYKGFFPGHIVSRNVLATIASIQWPTGFCELRLPTIIKAMGFSCGRLPFPFVQNKKLSKPIIERSSSFGIFHSVRDEIILNPNSDF